MSDASTLDLRFTMAPNDIVMPQPLEAIITGTFAVSAFAIAAFALYLCVKRRTPVPLLLMFGGLFTCMLEAPADIMINVTHPAIGQMNAFVSKGVAVPVYVVLAYFSYYGSLGVFLYDRIVAQSITSATWWKLTAWTAVTLVLGEALFTWLGLFHFYGRHPLWIGPMPLWFEGANTTSLIVPVLVIYSVLPLLTGWKQWLILAIMPAVGCAAHFGAGVPAYNVLGMNQAELPQWVIEVSGVVSVAFSVLLIWLGIQLAGMRLQVAPRVKHG